MRRVYPAHREAYIPWCVTGMVGRRTYPGVYQGDMLGRHARLYTQGSMLGRYARLYYTPGIPTWVCTPGYTTPLGYTWYTAECRMSAVPLTGDACVPCNTPRLYSEINL